MKREGIVFEGGRTQELFAEGEPRDNVKRYPLISSVAEAWYQ